MKLTNTQTIHFEHYSIVIEDDVDCPEDFIQISQKKNRMPPENLMSFEKSGVPLLIKALQSFKP